MRLQIVLKFILLPILIIVGKNIKLYLVNGQSCIEVEKQLIFGVTLQKPDPSYKMN